MAQSASVDRSARTGPVSQRVISAVAELTGTDPVALEPLYDAVDPDALDALFATGQGRSQRASRRVEFSYNGCDVEVSADGAVRATRAE